MGLFPCAPSTWRVSVWPGFYFVPSTAASPIPAPKRSDSPCCPFPLRPQEWLPRILHTEPFTGARWWALFHVVLLVARATCEGMRSLLAVVRVALSAAPSGHCSVARQWRERRHVGFATPARGSDLRRSPRVLLFGVVLTAFWSSTRRRRACPPSEGASPCVELCCFLLPGRPVGLPAPARLRAWAGALPPGLGPSLLITLWLGPPSVEELRRAGCPAWSGSSTSALMAQLLPWWGLTALIPPFAMSWRKASLKNPRGSPLVWGLLLAADFRPHRCLSGRNALLVSCWPSSHLDPTPMLLAILGRGSAAPTAAIPVILMYWGRFRLCPAAGVLALAA